MSAQPSSSTDVATPSTATELSPQEELPQKPERDPRYPLSVLYCPVCTFPPELHEYHSRTHFEKYVNSRPQKVCRVLDNTLPLTYNPLPKDARSGFARTPRNISQTSFQMNVLHD